MYVSVGHHTCDVTSLWKTRKVLVVLVRKLHCRFCAEQFGNLKASIPSLADSGIKVIILTADSEEDVAVWKKQMRCPCDVYQLAADAQVIFNVMSHSQDDMEEGHSHGGVFVMGPGNVCSYGFQSLYPGHHPDFKTIPQCIVQDARQKVMTVVSFTLVAAGFSVVEACFVATLVIAPAILGMQLGSLSSGLIYLSFSVSTLMAPRVVTLLTPRVALITGLATFTACIASSALCYVNKAEGISEWLLLASSVVAGSGGAILWTAEGVYVSRSASQYTNVSSHYKTAEMITHNIQQMVKGSNAPMVTYEEEEIKEQSRALDIHAGMFNGIFQLTLPCIFLTSSFLVSTYSVGVMYLILMLLAAVAMCLAGSAKCPRRLKKSLMPALTAGMGSGGISTPTPSSPASRRTDQWLPDTLHVVMLDKRVQYLIPCNLAMGMMVAVMADYINATVVKPHYGAQDIGYFVALQGGSAAVFSPFLVYIASTYGRPVVMTIGALAWSVECFMFVVAPSNYVTMPVIVVAYLLHGLGYSVWQGTATAVHAALFMHEPKWLDSAFANMKLWSGMGSAIGYFLFPLIPDRVSLFVALVFVLAGLVFYRQSLTLSALEEEEEDEDFFIHPRATTVDTFQVAVNPPAFMGTLFPFDTHLDAEYNDNEAEPLLQSG
eukprot:TRINITY_DN1857_c0_g1_i1.p1 TRINITY_DN1857_c0_g1~~TRINITY_DN1857_c0_g1_i1.p1  ORF type:complete len:660 (+),score=98.54 TRINITY_DN1857_c0_g1_i1:2439-4418(+)